MHSFKWLLLFIVSLCGYKYSLRHFLYPTQWDSKVLAVMKGVKQSQKEVVERVCVKTFGECYKIT